MMMELGHLRPKTVQIADCCCKRDQSLITAGLQLSPPEVSTVRVSVCFLCWTEFSACWLPEAGQMGKNAQIQFTMADWFAIQFPSAEDTREHVILMMEVRFQRMTQSDYHPVDNTASRTMEQAPVEHCESHLTIKFNQKTLLHNNRVYLYHHMSVLMAP
jgi:hypothetical protein